VFGREQGTFEYLMSVEIPKKFKEEGIKDIRLVVKVDKDAPDESLMVCITS